MRIDERGRDIWPSLRESRVIERVDQGSAEAGKPSGRNEPPAPAVYPSTPQHLIPSPDLVSVKYFMLILFVFLWYNMCSSKMSRYGGKRAAATGVEGAADTIDAGSGGKIRRLSPYHLALGERQDWGTPQNTPEAGQGTGRRSSRTGERNGKG